MTPQELIEALNNRRRQVERLWCASGARPDTPPYVRYQQAYRAVAGRWIRALIAFNCELGRCVPVESTKEPRKSVQVVDGARSRQPETTTRWPAEIESRDAVASASAVHRGLLLP